jgi:hypothetical protein
VKPESLSFGLQVVLLISKYHGSLVSWGRYPAYNALVGGSVNPPSRHTTWDGIDASFLEEQDRDDYFAACKRIGLFGYTKKTRRKGIPVYSCHIQRVKPARSVV